MMRESRRVGHTFVFEEVAHSRAASEHELRYILDNFGFVLGRERSKPLSKALEEGL